MLIFFVQLWEIVLQCFGSWLQGFGFKHSCTDLTQSCSQESVSVHVTVKSYHHISCCSEGITQTKSRFLDSRNNVRK